MQLAHGHSLVGVEPGGSAVLTYDDGPEPGATEAIAQVLSGHDSTATFFVLLSRARQNRDLLQSIVTAGHEVALHGVDHRRLPDGPARLISAVLTDARKELEDMTGKQVRWFRPPYGAQSIAVWTGTRSAGLVPVLWTIQCRDWLTMPMTDYLEKIRGVDLDGAIILLHDGFADQRDGVDDGPSPQLDRVALTEAVLAETQRQSLRVRDLSETLSDRTPLTRVWLDDLHEGRSETISPLEEPDE